MLIAVNSLIQLAPMGARILLGPRRSPMDGPMLIQPNA
jgi:hypothetical protein